MRTSDMIKSKFWRAADLEGRAPVILTIADVNEEVMGRGPRPDVKVVMWFHEHPKGLRLSKTSINTLEAAYGPESNVWSGRKVKLMFDPTVEFGGRRVGGVKLVTPPGIVYSPAQNPNLSAWGEAPAAVPGRPPAPVWDEQKGDWVTPPALIPKANRPPPPVWNEATQSWETVNPQTGEIAGQPSPTTPQAPGMPARAPTISQRIAEYTPHDEWGEPQAPTEDFNDPIPF